MVTRISAFLCAVALIVAVPSASSAELDATAWRKVASTLEAEASPASLSTAALIHFSTLQDKSKALALLDGAAALAPTDPSIAWLALNVCGLTEGCDVTDRTARLVDLDGGNAAVHYHELARARQRKDAAAEDRALAAMGDSGYFDIYWSRSLVRACDTLALPRGPKKKPLREIRWATSEVTGWLAQATVPTFQQASETCKGDRLLRDDVRAQCRSLSNALENGDTFVAQMFGRSLEKRLLGSDDPGLAAVAERQRQYNYLSEKAGPLSAKISQSEESTNAWLNRFRVHRREVDVYRAWLVELGIPPDAPP
jgi:hypothetical protein